MMYRANDGSTPAVVFEDAEENRPRVDGASPSTELINIHDGVSVSPDMEILSLANRSFSGSLKAEVRLLTNLQQLDISNNNFTGVPAEVGQLSKLEVLDLSYNPLTGLPHEIGNLQNLKTLDLRGTNYSRQDLEVIRAALSKTVTILVD